MAKASRLKAEIDAYLSDPITPNVEIADLGAREDDYVRRLAKPREALVRAANAAAAMLFVGKPKLSDALLRRAREHAFRAIQQSDRMAGTARHPHAPYSHGIATLAAEGVDQAVEGWKSVNARRDARGIFRR